LAIFFHWSIVVLIVAAYATMDLKSLTPRASPQRESLAVWHYVLGLSVFAFVWLRVLVRAAGPAPAIEPPLVLWEAALARAAHFVLYVFMIDMPLLGWLTVSAKGQPVLFLRMELPALIGKSENLARQFKEIHEGFATVGYFLIGLHSAAALFHHYVKRDNTLTLMWPGYRFVLSRRQR
jgi:cytochrome b561